MACRKSLEKFIGKDYLSKNGEVHFRVLRIKTPSSNPHDPFRFHTLEGCGFVSWVPLRNEIASAITPKNLLKNYVEKTPAIQVLYGQIKKDPQPKATEECG